MIYVSVTLLHVYKSRCPSYTDLLSIFMVTFFNIQHFNPIKHKIFNILGYRNQATVKENYRITQTRKNKACLIVEPKEFQITYLYISDYNSS